MCRPAQSVDHAAGERTEKAGLISNFAPLTRRNVFREFHLPTYPRDNGSPRKRGWQNEKKCKKIILVSEINWGINHFAPQNWLHIPKTFISRREREIEREGRFAGEQRGAEREKGYFGMVFQRIIRFLLCFSSLGVKLHFWRKKVFASDNDELLLPVSAAITPKNSALSADSGTAPVLPRKRDSATFLPLILFRANSFI